MTFKLHSTDRIIFITAIVVAFSGCSTTMQTTSGTDYLSRWNEAAQASAMSNELVETTAISEDAIRAAAAIEPLLTFPARIGLARIEKGAITAVPPEEAESWAALEVSLNVRSSASVEQPFGTLVPISPLIAAMVAPQIAYDNTLSQSVQRIRLAAARQHVDAVFIYEVAYRSDRRKTSLAASDLTLIGAVLLPSRKVEVEGLAQAMLIDVRNGYPYGTASASVDATKTATAYRQRDVEGRLATQVMAQTVEALTEDAKTLFIALQGELALAPNLISSSLPQ